MDIAPLTVGMLRTGLAALLTAPLLMAYRMRPPARSHQRALLGLVIVGSLIAFPVLFSLGVGRTSAAHAGLILAALPLPTGLFGALSSAGCRRPLGGSARRSRCAGRLC